jgi:hypothetical protein
MGTWIIQDAVMFYDNNTPVVSGLGESFDTLDSVFAIRQVIGFFDLQALALSDLVYDIISDSFTFSADNYGFFAATGSHLLEYDLVPITWMKKDADGNAIVLRYNIRARVDTSIDLHYEILEMTPVTKALTLNFAMLSGSVEISYDLRVTDLINGTEFTGKIKDITITYSIDQYCGECEITWLDWTLFEVFDVANQDYFGKLRLRVETKMGNDPWVSQGDFLIEKRNTTVTPEGIAMTTWGRSKTALLGEPYGKPRTTGWVTDMPASGIARELVEDTNTLLGTDISLSWEIYEYTVLSDKLYVQSQFPIEVISKLAEAIGGLVTTDQEGNVKVIYRYG